MTGRIRESSLILVFLALAAFGSLKSGAAQSTEQLSQALSLIADEKGSGFPLGREVRLAPVDPAVTEAAILSAYDRLQREGFRPWGEERWPDSTVALLNLGLKENPEYGWDIWVRIRNPDLPFRGTVREGYRPYSATTWLYMLKCDRTECQPPESGIHLSGGGLIDESCVPDVFARTVADRRECFISGLEGSGEWARVRSGAVWPVRHPPGR